MEWRKPKINDLLLFLVTLLGTLATLLGNGFYWQYKSSQLGKSRYDLSLRQFRENAALEHEKLDIEKSKHMLEISKNEIDRDRKTIDAGKYDIERKKHEIEVKLFELEREKHNVSKEKYRMEKIKEIVALRDRKTDLLTQIILLTENYMSLNEQFNKTPSDRTLYRNALQHKMKLDAVKKNHNELEINLAELEDRQPEKVNLDFLPKLVPQAPSGLMIK